MPVASELSCVGDVSERQSFSIVRHNDLVPYASIREALLHVGSRDRGMSHGLHVADYDLGSIARANDVFHVAVIHDEAAFIQQEGCACIHDNNVGVPFVYGFGHCIIPDRVTGDVQRFFVGMMEHDAAGGAARNFCAMPGRNFDKRNIA